MFFEHISNDKLINFIVVFGTAPLEWFSILTRAMYDPVEGSQISKPEVFRNECIGFDLFFFVFLFLNVLLMEEAYVAYLLA